MRLSKPFLFLSTIFLFTVIGCEDAFKDKQAIPYVPVDVKIELWMAEYKDLEMTSYPVYLTTYNGKGLGYNHNGIIVMQNTSNVYKCYDATCTKDLDCAITIQRGDPVAKCPKCGTQYLLEYGYQPGYSDSTQIEKVYPLQEYRVIQTGKTLIITN